MTAVADLYALSEEHVAFRDTIRQDRKSTRLNSSHQI